MLLQDHSIPTPQENPEYFETYVPEETFELEAALSSAERQQLRELFQELARREREALKLVELMSGQKAVLESEAPERLIIGGNRGGKTMAAAIEIAQAVTGQDPRGRYPKRDGWAVAVGWDLQHCADTQFKKLFNPGSFQIIQDPDTSEWRAFRPREAWDSEHEWLARPAPPLIPDRFIKSIAWDNKALRIAKSVNFTTGWLLTFFSSKGDPPQGAAYDLAWFDEEIEGSIWYSEMAARLVEKRRKQKDGSVQRATFLWTATPLAATQTLVDLHNRAEAQQEMEHPSIQEFCLTQLDNPHMSEQSKREFAEKLSEEEYDVRVMGGFAMAGVRIYPELSIRGPHGCDPFPIPNDWCRYCAIDPGRQVCAVLFCAVPPAGRDIILPDKDGNEINYGRGRKFLYNELYIKRCDAKTFAKRMKEAVGESQLQQWWIDHRAGRISEIGSGYTIEEQYSSALKAEKLACEKTGYKFTWGSDDPKARIETVRAGLHLDDLGFGQWLIFRNLKYFKMESEKYAFRRLPNKMVTDEPIKLNDHLMDDWGYLATARLPYVRPKARAQDAGYTNRALAAKREREKARRKTKSGWGDAIPLS